MTRRMVWEAGFEPAIEVSKTPALPSLATPNRSLLESKAARLPITGSPIVCY
jgi:hypothetical protein